MQEISDKNEPFSEIFKIAENDKTEQISLN